MTMQAPLPVLRSLINHTCKDSVLKQEFQDEDCLSVGTITSRGGEATPAPFRIGDPKSAWRQAGAAVIIKVVMGKPCCGAQGLQGGEATVPS